MVTIETLLQESPYIIIDGAMGTMLFASGLEHGDAPELWNAEHPEKVAAIHRAYLEAGAQLILTNTFGGNRYRLALHNLENRVAELNSAAVGILRVEVGATGRKALVAGDIGPSGQVMAPYGDLSYEAAVECFAEQAAALINSGVDLIWIETMADLNEVQAAMEGVRRVSKEIPITVTMTFDTHGRTMIGVTPEKAAATLITFGALAVGANCGNGPEEIISVIEKMRVVAPAATLIAKSNAGIPQLVAGRPVYRATPAYMADYARKAYVAGARIIGSCCGSTPDHTRAIADALASLEQAG